MLGDGDVGRAGGREELGDPVGLVPAWRVGDGRRRKRRAHEPSGLRDRAGREPRGEREPPAGPAERDEPAQGAFRLAGEDHREDAHDRVGGLEPVRRLLGGADRDVGVQPERAEARRRPLDEPGGRVEPRDPDAPPGRLDECVPGPAAGVDQALARTQAERIERDRRRRLEGGRRQPVVAVAPVKCRSPGHPRAPRYRAGPRLAAMGEHTERSTLAASVASILGVAASDVPLDDDGLRAWLAARGLGLVPVAGAPEFSWAGPWIAWRPRSDGGGRAAAVMFGVPSGAVFDPGGNDGRGPRGRARRGARHRALVRREPR